MHLSNPFEGRTRTQLTQRTAAPSGRISRAGISELLLGRPSAVANSDKTHTGSPLARVMIQLPYVASERERQHLEAMLQVSDRLIVTMGALV